MTQPLYFVWRPHARTAFRTYRAGGRRPLPGDQNLLWQGSCYRSGLRVQAAANRHSPGRKANHPQQMLLCPGWFATFA